MNVFLRQMVALSALWALCELLLPEGGLSRMARLVVSLLVMTVLVTSIADALSGWTGMAAGSAAALGTVAGQSAQGNEQAGQGAYMEAFLRSQANQAEDLCVRMARGAGHDADAAVYLRTTGELERIELMVRGQQRDDTPPLLSIEELRQKIAEAFGVDASRVRLSADEGESE